MKTYKDLDVWQNAYKVTLQIYKVTMKFPVEEKFGLTSQIRRSCISVCANIVEGSSRQTRKEFIQFLYQARGSLSETEFHLMLSNDLGFIKKLDYENIIQSYTVVAKQLNALISSLKSSLHD